MSATGVTVYTNSTCPWCDRVKDFLGKAGVPYEEKRVDSDYDAAMEMIKRSGQQGVPVGALALAGLVLAQLARQLVQLRHAKELSAEARERLAVEARAVLEGFAAQTSRNAQSGPSLAGSGKTWRG